MKALYHVTAKSKGFVVHTSFQVADSVESAIEIIKEFYAVVPKDSQWSAYKRREL